MQTDGLVGPMCSVMDMDLWVLFGCHNGCGLIDLWVLCVFKWKWTCGSHVVPQVNWTCGSPILANSSKRKNPAKPRRQTNKVRMSANDASCWPNLDTSVERMSGVIGSFFVVAHANFL